MKNKKEIPDFLRKKYDDDYNIDYLGRYNNMDAYNVYIPEGCTGLPRVLLCDDKEIKEDLFGFEAMQVIDKFIK